MLYQIAKENYQSMICWWNTSLSFTESNLYPSPQTKGLSRDIWIVLLMMLIWSVHYIEQFTAWEEIHTWNIKRNLVKLENCTYIEQDQISQSDMIFLLTYEYERWGWEMRGIWNRHQGLRTVYIGKTLKTCLSNYKKLVGCRVIVMQTFVPNCSTHKTGISWQNNDQYLDNCAQDFNFHQNLLINNCALDHNKLCIHPNLLISVDQ